LENNKNSSNNERRKGWIVAARVVCIVILITTLVLSGFTFFLRHCENNHRYFLAGTRIHAVKPRVYDAHYSAGSLVFVRSAPVRELDEGALISMAVNAEFPLTFNNERFIEFQEEFFGRSLHGIVTENTAARERLPLRGGRYIGVPYMSIPGLGSILVWASENNVISSTIAILIIAGTTAVLIVTRSKKVTEDSGKLTFPKKKTA